VGRALDMPELAEYDTNALMLEHRAEIYELLSSRLKTDITAHWMDALLAYDVWCAPVQTYDDLMTDPQAEHNKVFWDVPIGDGGASFRTPGSPFVFSATPARLHRGVPDLGQHTAQVLGPDDDEAGNPVTAKAGARDLGDGIYQLPTDYPEVCNAPLWTYMITDGDVFGLVDPGITSTLEATLGAAIAELGFTTGQADLLLATHGHPDHSGGQGSWESAAPSARIAAPLEDTPWVESFDKQWTRFWDDYPGVMDLRDDRRSLAGLCVPEPSWTCCCATVTRSRSAPARSR